MVRHRFQFHFNLSTIAGASTSSLLANLRSIVSDIWSRCGTCYPAVSPRSAGFSGKFYTATGFSPREVEADPTTTHGINALNRFVIRADIPPRIDRARKGPEDAT